LEGADLSEQFRRMIGEVVRGYVEGATASGYAEEWELDQLWTALKTLYPVSLSLEEAIEQAGGRKSDLTREFLVEELVADAESAYDAREEDLGSEVMRELERRVLLSVLDRKWREHLYEMDYLQEGIGLRAMAQRDPLVEYQREGFDMFSAMMDAIKEESVGFLFNLEVEIEDAASSAPAGDADVPAIDTGDGADRDEAVDGGPHLDAALLAAAQHAHDGAVPTPNRAVPNGRSASPHISAKGLDRDASSRPLIYSSPTLGSDAPEVRMASEDEEASSRSSGSSSAGRRQQNRANPNRGSRGNRSARGNARKRKR
jgi:preprotein translocase subunit SecA